MATPAPPAPPGTPPAGPPPPQPTADGVPAGSEDARFLAFAKENIALLAGVASVPMLSSAAGALKPPMNMDQLTVLSSLLCVIVFAACFTVRGIVGAAPRSRSYIIRAIPGTLSLLIVGLGVYLIGEYSTLYKQTEIAATLQRLPAPAGANGASGAEATGASGPSAPGPSSTTGASGASAVTGAAGASGPSGASAATGPTAATGETPARTDAAKVVATAPGPPLALPENLRTQVILFLSIYPTLILALGLLLVTSFTQQTARDIQAVIEQRIPEQAHVLFERVKLIANFYDMARKDPDFKKIGQDLINERNGILELLSLGIIELGGDEAIRMQQTLVETFTESFDAVSCKDLDFWVKRDDKLSREYFRLNLEAIKRHHKVTRLLIFSDKELARPLDVCKALDEHQKYGIGWAVVPFMDLDPSTREVNEDVALDFGLYDKTRVAIYFRNYAGKNRRLRAVFPGPHCDRVIAKQRERYLQLAAECWLVSGTFLSRLEQLSAKELAELKKAAARNAKVTSQQLGLTDRVAKFAEAIEKLEKPEPPIVDLKDCFLFPNCETDVPGHINTMVQLRKSCPDWSGPKDVATLEH